MNTNILYFTIQDGEGVNRPALTEALGKYSVLEYGPGHWFIKGNVQPHELLGAIRGVVGSLTPIIFRVDTQSLPAAVLTDDVKRFVTSPLTQVA
jgi:hypothetical protein